MKKELFERTVNSLEFFLNPKIFGNAEFVRQISDHLVSGDLVVIRDAVQEPFAERMFVCLDGFSDWKVYEGYEKHFHYHHHNIYDEKLFPLDLSWCQEIFRSDSTKNFIQRLSQRDCNGETIFSASLYAPGDHSLPHNDFLGHENEYRQVAFVWYLTKQWQPDWGGDFFWCPKSRYVSPSFNTLLLFNVGSDSLHFVTHVSPHAQSKRLAISGWWTSKGGSGDHATRGQAENTDKKLLIEII